MRRDVAIERIDEGAEGEVALELRCGAGEDNVPPRLRAPAQLSEQPRLADARLSLDRQAGRLAPVQRVKHLLEASQLSLAPDHRLRVHRAGEDNPSSAPFQGSGGPLPQVLADTLEV